MDALAAGLGGANTTAGLAGIFADISSRVLALELEAKSLRGMCAAQELEIRNLQVACAAQVAQIRELQVTCAAQEKQLKDRKTDVEVLKTTDNLLRAQLRQEVNERKEADDAVGKVFPQKSPS